MILDEAEEEGQRRKYFAKKAITEDEQRLRDAFHMKLIKHKVLAYLKIRPCSVAFRKFHFRTKSALCDRLINK